MVVVAGLGVSDASGHDLEFSRLVLRVGPTQVRGELSLDPKASGSAPGSTLGQRTAAVEKYARDHVTLSFDDASHSPTRPARVSIIDVADLADPTGLDLVEIAWRRPPASRSFYVRSSEQLGDLAVSVEHREAGGIRAHSALVRGGEVSPGYALGAGDAQIWREGGVDVLSPATSASAAAPPRRARQAASAAPSSTPPQENVGNAAVDDAASGFDESRARTAWRYLKWGFEHILPLGLDHILFIVGLVLLSLRPRDILLWVTLFTVAHTATLGLSALGVVGLSPQIVEPLIAFSIAYVGIEGVSSRSAERAAVLRRAVVVFAFGLLHGLGFAGVLGEIGLAPSAFLLSLVSFNVGVELGQLSVVAAASAMLALLPPRARDWVRHGSALAIGVVGLCWGVLRLIEGW